ncbi:MAG: hypothetical protein F4X44_09080 [Gammaproteobacteria bacterium]|nr:hypothetical protein [Gammaproteobacteria bacterium]MYD80752.1 hypothetical protein [Gammaproteobacteria bacterium]
MKSTRSKDRFAALLAVGFLIGVGSSCEAYWLFLAAESNDKLADSVAPSSPTASELSTDDPRSPAEASNVSEPSIATVRSLEDILRIKSLFEQQLALHIFLSELDEAEVDDLLTQTQDVFPEDHRNELQIAIVQRLASQNPNRALSRVLEMFSDHEYMQAVSNVFREWAHSNLNEAVSHARTLDQIPKGLALSAIVHTRADLAESTLRAIALDLGNEQIAVSAIAQRKAKEAIRDPEKAWNEGAVPLQGDAANSETIARIGMAWVNESGLGVLDQIYQSLTDSETRQSIIRSVLEQIAHMDPEGAFNFALTIESDPNDSILRDLADNWANSDPRSALTAVSGIERESLRNAVADSLVNSWAQNRPKEMFEALDGLPAEFQEKALTAAINAMLRESREETAHFVVAMEPSSLKTTSARIIASFWSNQGDPWSALEWILDEPGFQDIRSELLSSIMDDLAKYDPELAMSTALDQPIDENGTGFGALSMGLEFDVISTLASWNLDKAIELLPQVRDGPTKIFATTRVAYSLIENDEIETAFDMAQQVPDTDRESFYLGLFTQWVLTDPVAALDSIDRFPSDEARSQMALMLIANDRYQKSLSDEQVEKAKKYLSDEQAKALEEGDSEVLPIIFREPRFLGY